jgi:hypothetical protein
VIREVRYEYAADTSICSDCLGGCFDWCVDGLLGAMFEWNLSIDCNLVARGFMGWISWAADRIKLESRVTVY